MFNRLPSFSTKLTRGRGGDYMLGEAIDSFKCKSDLLPKFISNKGRAFSAHLKLENGKVGFEFAEKTPRARKSAPRRAAV